MLKSNMDLWKKINDEANNMHLFSSDRRASISKLARDEYCISMDNLTLDFSYQVVNKDIIGLLIELADSCNLHGMIGSLMDGGLVNTSENKPALHTATRASAEERIFFNNQNIVDFVLKEREQMYEIAEKIRQGDWCGYTNKKITDVVNIGVGGSHLGAQFCISSFTDLVTDKVKFYFISDIDPNAFRVVVSKLQPETTLFIIASKSFTTEETMANARRAQAWIGSSQYKHRHFIAITAFPAKAKEQGYKHVLSIGDWVGGRFSFCSAMNLITCIAIGKECFSAMLEGARNMDEHFRHTPFVKNLPVMLGLLGIWNNNFLEIYLLFILTYGYGFDSFVSYIQQLDMESNGKSFDKQGRDVNYATGPIVLGGGGTQIQHSYYQLLCQGTHKLAVDLISFEDLSRFSSTQLCLAHREIFGKGFEDAQNPLNYIPGNIPVNHIQLRDNSPKSIGSVIALYEHKVFVQSVIWNINPFDQPGVDGAKQIYRDFAINSPSQKCSYKENNIIEKAIDEIETI